MIRLELKNGQWCELNEGTGEWAASHPSYLPGLEALRSDTYENPGYGDPKLALLSRAVDALKPVNVINTYKPPGPDDKVVN